MINTLWRSTRREQVLRKHHASCFSLMAARRRQPLLRADSGDDTSRLGATRVVLNRRGGPRETHGECVSHAACSCRRGAPAGLQRRRRARPGLYDEEEGVGGIGSQRGGEGGATLCADDDLAGIEKSLPHRVLPRGLTTRALRHSYSDLSCSDLTEAG